ncbi:MAG: hypothetical protein JO149_04145 [Gammaproteobacteria bacterium]|nr:hypothetical protein [Gammaproteobacteria bacterium]
METRFKIPNNNNEIETYIKNEFKNTHPTQNFYQKNTNNLENGKLNIERYKVAFFSPSTPVKDELINLNALKKAFPKAFFVLEKEQSAATIKALEEYEEKYYAEKPVNFAEHPATIFKKPGPMKPATPLQNDNVKPKFKY